MDVVHIPFILWYSLLPIYTPHLTGAHILVKWTFKSKDSGYFSERYSLTTYVHVPVLELNCYAAIFLNVCLSAYVTI